MVVWAVGGLAYTDVYPARSVAFWQLTTVLFAIIAIVHVVRSDVGRPHHPGAEAARALGRLPGGHGCCCTPTT